MSFFYKETGTGFPVVFVHGFCETHTVWEPLTPELTSHFRIIVIDLPGFGESELSTDSITIEEVAEMVYSSLKEINIEKCVMIGHSLGGYITLSMAEKHPEFLVGLGLFHSTSYADAPEKKLNRTKTIAFIEEYGVESFVEAFFPMLFADSEHTMIPELVQNASKTKKRTVIAYTKAMRDRKDRSEVLSSVNLPILIVCGEKDKAVPKEHSIMQSKLAANTSYHQLESTGHMGMYENKNESVKVILEFVQNSLDA